LKAAKREPGAVNCTLNPKLKLEPCVELRNVNHLWKTFTCPLLVLLVLLGGGCSTLLPQRNQLPLHRQSAPLPSESACRVAVLPFLNDSDFPLGDAIFNKVFTAQFQESGDHLVIQEGDILKVYQQLHILPGEAPALEQLQIIADRVNAQLLITGIVLEMRETPGEHGTVNPMLIVEIEIRDGRSGEALWTTFHRRQGTDYKKVMHFGTLYTVAGLSRQMAEEIINLWIEKGLPQCNVSSRS
jgi:hypothetical protein